MTIFGKEPVFWIGLIATIIVGVIQQVLGVGLISDVTAGKAIDLVTAFQQLLVLLAPLAAAIISRPSVTPVVKPSLPKGTTVNVITPGDQPNTRIVL